MRITRQVICGLAALALLAVWVPPAGAQARRPFRAYAGAMDLTAEQLDRIDELRLSFRNDALSLEAKWGRLDLELEAMSRKGQDLGAKLKELDALEREMDKMWETHQNQVRSVLTDDQKALFDRFGGLGLGMGPGLGYGAGPRLGLGMGVGRGRGYGWAPGEGRGIRGYGRYPRYGRGYCCPWRRW